MASAIVSRSAATVQTGPGQTLNRGESRVKKDFPHRLKIHHGKALARS